MIKKRHSLSVIKSIRNDRLVGFTISQLVEKYSISKTTIWHHIHDIELPQSIKTKILSGKGGSTKRKFNQIARAEKEASILLRGNDRELVMAVAMLYWAEGHKKSFVFTNTDYRMLKLYIKFLNKVLGINKEDYRILIRTSDPIVPDSAIQYWSKVLNLPSSVFKANHDNIQNRTKTKFGICRIMVVKSNYHHKIILSLINRAQLILLSL
jgi:hypothetical protein